MTATSSTILIRTNAGSYTGIGHLVRCLQLAEQLLARNAEVIFVLDFIEPKIEAFLANSKVESLYNEIQSEISSEQDASLFIQLLNKYQATHVIVDDYRLAKDWETLVKAKSKHDIVLLAIDDILREHKCDLLIDMKWRGNNTDNAYDQLVPKKAVKLLGPAYVLLNEQYQMKLPNNTRPINKQDKAFAINQHETSCFTVMFGLGGGGDISQCQQLINNVLANSNLLNFNIKILVILGPLAINSDSFIETYNDIENVKLIIGETNLFPYLQQTHLYIGAAGGILYQLLALNIPALTFAIAENQDSERQQLEQLGHYFHLDKISDISPDILIQFINSIANSYPRILHLLQNADVKIDGMGTNRVAQALLTYDKAAANNLELMAPAINHDLLSKQNIEIQQDTFSPEMVSDFISLPENYQLRPVNDSDINHYLTSRNLPSNCQNMIKAEPIPLLSHYSWWFNAKRESYLLSHNGKPILYIWHEIKNVQNKNYLIGGWFVCERELGFQEALLALNWQLALCNEYYPDTPWLAVIHRENKFVRLLNKYLGFTDVGTEHAYHLAIKTLFKDADSQDFYYVTYINEQDNKSK